MTPEALERDGIERCAEELWTATKTRVPVAPIRERYKLDIRTAYAVQRANRERAVADGGGLRGHKIGLTSKPMQEQLGVGTPDFGVILDDMVVESGSTVCRNSLIEPRIETEIAFLLHRDLVGPGVSTIDALRATDAVLPALEIIDSRIEGWDIAFVDTVADNASSGCVVLGSRLVDPRSFDLRTVGCVLERDGSVAETGAGAAALGHPARCLAWLANALSDFGEGLCGGEVVLAGSLHRAVPLTADTTFRAELAGLGTVEVSVE